MFAEEFLFSFDVFIFVFIFTYLHCPEHTPHLSGLSV